MASLRSTLPYDPTNPISDEQEPAAKRIKTQACSRCRRRKKCDMQRPCHNCRTASQQCNEPVALYGYVEDPRRATSISAPFAGSAEVDGVESLEQRVTRLEATNRQFNMMPTREIASYDQSPELKRSPAKQPVIPGDSNSNISEHESLARSSPAIGLLAAFARLENEHHSPPLLRRRSTAVSQTHDTSELQGRLGESAEESLFDIYQEKVHCRYPFLPLSDIRDVTKRQAGHWTGFFTNMIFSIGLLLERNSQSDISRHPHQHFYRIAVTQFLSHVFALPERLLHIQAYLLLAMHAMYSPSTERIISLASATMRYCVMAQLHLADTEPEPIDAATKLEIQMRRRAFWSAYSLDRAVGTAFDLPFAIPDYQITVQMYANTNDNVLSEQHVECRLEDSQPKITSVSFALHVIYCRQIQSEILNTTLHRDFGKQFDQLSNWRLGVLDKLDRWKSLCHRYPYVHPGTAPGRDWLHMIYNYSLAMLYQPTKSTVAGPAGDWTVKSCVQACLIFRKVQRETQIAELWLGLIVQFKCGVALLYCFYATPPQLRSIAYEAPEVSEAVRACSIILSILAERWPQARCARDAFDILAREIPLFDPSPPPQETSGPRRMRQASSQALLALLSQLETIIVHRNTLRLIKEMALDEFPRPGCNVQEPPAEMEHLVVAETEIAAGDSPTWRTSMMGDFFQPVTPYFFHPDLSVLDPAGFDYMEIGFPAEFDPLASL